MNHSFTFSLHFFYFSILTIYKMAQLNCLNLFNVQGRVAVVTGGSSGLGLMICKGLVSNGAKVYVVALPGDPIDDVVKELNRLGSETGGSALGFPCDLSSKSSIQTLAQEISTRETHLDMLISNAGIRRDPPIQCNVLTASITELQESMWSSNEADWEKTFRVNTTAHYFLSVALLPLLAAAAAEGRDQGRGVIVITSSCASMHNVTNIDLSSYAASKAATDHLVKLLAAKYHRFYVRVCGINPGFVPSNMNPVGAEGNIFSNLFDKVPAKRAAVAEDIAGTVLYLVSKAGAYVDGISLCVDGGRILLANGQE
uniref:Rhamnolipids biosynthesis 3-oxoacyl-[acyl-carrier-protein] reductase n=2 Tax=Talaromyces marneffei TaxID=37727 RepID=A0A093UXA1_TALMA